MKKQTSAKKTSQKANKKVDFEPNKVAFAVACVAVVSLVLITVIVMY